MYFKNIYSLYEGGLYERPLLTILVNLGYFDGKLKIQLLKAVQEKKIELLENFSAISLSSIEEDLVPILTKLHSLSENIDKESDKDIKKNTERLIRNLENYA